MVVDPAKYKVYSRYAKFNKQFFNGELPKIPITFSRLKNVGGFVNAITTRKTKYDTPVLKDGSMFMKISTTMLRTEQGLDEILLHEMIHVWFFHKGDFKENHGSKFIRKAKEIGDIVGYKIPLTDNITALDIHEDAIKTIAVLLFKETNGQYVYATVSATAARDKLATINEYFAKYLEERKMGNFAGLYLINTAMWNKHALKSPAQRMAAGKLKRYYLRDPLLVDDLIKNGKLVHSVGIL